LPAIIKKLLWFPLLILLSGCWDSHYIENINYITALGFDYVDDQFIAYGQMLDFGSIAKQEGGRKPQPAQAWVGKGKGETFNLALNDLYRTAQQRILWSQITSIVITERALQHGTAEFHDAITRYREIRFTPWVYATKVPIEQLFVTPAFFNLSELATIQHDPVQNYKQQSWIKPLPYMQYATDSLEPGKTVAVPALTIQETQWKRNDVNDPKMLMRGAHLVKNGKYQGYLTHTQLVGLRWMTPETNRSPIIIPGPDNTVETLSMERPKVHVKTIFAGDEPSFAIEVDLIGNIVEMDSPMRETEMNQKVEAVVQQQIQATYMAALEKHIDIYQLEYYAYRDHFKAWKQLTAHEPFALSKSSLASVKVSVHLVHAGMLEERNDAAHEVGG